MKAIERLIDDIQKLENILEQELFKPDEKEMILDKLASRYKIISRLASKHKERFVYTSFIKNLPDEEKP